MAPSPGDFRSDPIAGQMRGAMTGKPLEFDRGERRINYTGEFSMPSADPPDGIESPVEIYQSYLDLDPSSRTSQRAAAAFKKRFGVDVPWRLDRAHLKIIRSAIGAIPEDAGSYDKAQSLLQLFRRPKSAGGLGLVFRKHEEPEVNINEAIDRRFVRCSEFSTAYYGAGLMLDLKMYPLEIPQVDGDGNWAPHSAIMVIDEETGERLFVDFQLKTVQRKSPYDNYYVETTADLFSNYLYNLSREMEGDQLEMSDDDYIPLLNVEHIAPHNASALLGLGRYYHNREEWEKAREYFRRATEANPNFTTAWVSLCLMTFDEEICRKAGRPIE